MTQNLFFFFGWRITNFGLPTADQLMYRGFTVKRRCTICFSTVYPLPIFSLNVSSLHVIFGVLDYRASNWTAQLIVMANKLIKHNHANVAN